MVGDEDDDDSDDFWGSMKMKHFHDSDDEKETDDVPNNFGRVSKYNAFSRIKITDITSNEINHKRFYNVSRIMMKLLTSYVYVFLLTHG